MKNNKIKPQKTREFNVENPPNVEGKNYERQPVNLHYIGCVFTHLIGPSLRRRASASPIVARNIALCLFVGIILVVLLVSLPPPYELMKL